MRTREAESGATLIEVLVALAVLGLVAVVFLSGLSSTAKANIITDEASTAQSLALSQMEYVKKVVYVSGATTYSAAPIGGGDYTGFSVNITAEALHVPDDGIQKISVMVNHAGRQALLLEGFKVNR